MELFYSPWMKHFLASVSNVTDDLLLVSPFIKLSLVRPMLLALPIDRNINVTVVTRLSPFTFQQMASDLAALELLLARPGAPGVTKLFRLDRLHAKIYVFDGRRIALGSSNLSITGMERNLEAILWADRPELASQILAGLEKNSAFRHPVSQSDLEALRVKLGGSPNSPEKVDELDVASDETELLQDAPDDAEPAATGATGSPADSDRQQAIGAFLASRTLHALNTLAGIPFESPTAATHRTLGQPATPEQLATERAAAESDISRLEREFLPVLGVTDPAWVPAGLSVCVHQSWCSVHSDLVANGLQKQMFGALGRELVLLRIATHFAKQMSFDATSAGPASIATNKTWNELDFDSMLEQKGLNVLLHFGEVGRGDARDRFAAIGGLVHIVRGPRAADGFIRAAIDDEILALSITDAVENPKNRLLAIAQEMGIGISYEARQTGGSQHEPVFECTVTVGKRVYGPCNGRSKRRAEVAVAALALESLAFKNGLSGTRRPWRRYELSAARAKACAELAQRLGLRQRESMALLDIALTHASVTNIDLTTRSYQRFAFVGSFVGHILLISSMIRAHGWRTEDVQNSVRLGLTVLERELFPIASRRWISVAICAQEIVW